MNNTNDTAVLTYSSFDGGGPEYRVKIEDTSVVQCTVSKKYSNPNHDQAIRVMNELGFFSLIYPNIALKILAIRTVLTPFFALS